MLPPETVRALPRPVSAASEGKLTVPPLTRVVPPLGL